jgi:Uncharacterized protein required for cytochrome oxidase assembly
MIKYNKSSKPIAVWLFVGVGMIMVQILLGGVTRLSGSGLSITEWNVATKIFLPTSVQGWLIEFEKYKQTPQFKFINSNFTLHDFQSIYFWEWFHRLWAKLMGVVFLIPFIIFFIQKRFTLKIFQLLFGLFLLGALQGSVGWIMVKSGLSGDAVYVQPVKLAIHLLLAVVLLCYTFYMALYLFIPRQQKVFAPQAKRATAIIITVVLVQFFFGALMSGYKAAVAAPTWPDINGAFIPAQVWGAGIPVFKNMLAIQFIHRTTAYLIFILVAVKFLYEYRLQGNPLFTYIKWAGYVLVLIQISLGILTVLSSRKIVPNIWGGFETLALIHQLVGMVFLLSMVFSYYLLQTKKLYQ